MQEIYKFMDCNGNIFYGYNENHLHREDGPSVIWTNGTKVWYKEGKLHRENGPAIENRAGDNFWFRNNKKHRIDGPAEEFANGNKFWFLDDVQYDEMTYKRLVKLLFLI